MPIKVVAVPTVYQLVINRGSSQGVRPGERYLVYREGEEVFDPDTGESLGVYEEVVGRARVILVKEKNSTLESDEFDNIVIEKGRLELTAIWGPDKRIEKEMKPIGAMVGDLAKRV